MALLKNKLKAIALRIANRIAIAMGMLGLGALLFFGLLRLYDLYNKWLQRPSEREAQYMTNFSVLTITKKTFPLREATPWPWDKVCNDYIGRGILGVDIDMDTYAAPDTLDPDDPRATLVFFVNGEKPWGIRVPAKYLVDADFGECVDNNYVVK